MGSEGTRINKYLSEIGYCSRRQADKLIEQGRVMVNSKETVMGYKVQKDDTIHVDGEKIKQTKITSRVTEFIGIPNHLPGPCDICIFYMSDVFWNIYKNQIFEHEQHIHGTENPNIVFVRAEKGPKKTNYKCYKVSKDGLFVKK